MNVLESKDYLEKQLPNVSVKIIEYYKDKPNNRYEFSRADVEKPVAILLAKNLPLTAELLDDIAVAVNKKFNETPVAKPAYTPPPLAPEVQTEQVAKSVGRDEYKALLDIFANSRSFEDARKIARQKLRELESDSPMT